MFRAWPSNKPAKFDTYYLVSKGCYYQLKSKKSDLAIAEGIREGEKMGFKLYTINLKRANVDYRKVKK
jgi:hypothetical protein